MVRLSLKVERAAYIWPISSARLVVGTSMARSPPAMRPMMRVTSATGRDTERDTRMLKASRPPIATRMTAIMAIIRVSLRLAVSSEVAALTASSLSLSCAMRSVRFLDKVRKSSSPMLAL